MQFFAAGADNEATCHLFVTKEPRINPIDWQWGKSAKNPLQQIHGLTLGFCCGNASDV